MKWVIVRTHAPRKSLTRSANLVEQAADSDAGPVAMGMLEFEEGCAALDVMDPTDEDQDIELELSPSGTTMTRKARPKKRSSSHHRGRKAVSRRAASSKTR